MRCRDGKGSGCRAGRRLQSGAAAGLAGRGGTGGRGGRPRRRSRRALESHLGAAPERLIDCRSAAWRARGGRGGAWRRLARGCFGEGGGTGERCLDSASARRREPHGSGRQHRGACRRGRCAYRQKAGATAPAPAGQPCRAACRAGRRGARRAFGQQCRPPSGRRSRAPRAQGRCGRAAGAAAAAGRETGGAVRDPGPGAGGRGGCAKPRGLRRRGVCSCSGGGAAGIRAAGARLGAGGSRKPALRRAAAC